MVAILLICHLPEIRDINSGRMFDAIAWFLFLSLCLSEDSVQSLLLPIYGQSMAFEMRI